MSAELEGTLSTGATLEGEISIGNGTKNYNDLRNKPSINDVELEGNKTSSELGFADVATSGSYDDLTDKPTIPAAQVNADWDSEGGVSEILNKPDLAKVATSGNYEDLNNTPSIPAPQVQADWNENDDSKADFIKNKPSIPSAQVNSDWNAVEGVAKILNKPTIPTKTSNLQNDSGYVTIADVIDDTQSDDDTTYSSDKIEAIVDALLPIDTKSGAIATFSTDLAKPLVSLKANVDAVQNLHGADGAYQAGGGKNIFPVKDVTTVSGITMTVRDDGGLLINGTAASSFNATVKSDLKAGTYILSCRFIGTPPTEGAARAQIYHQATGLSYQISNPDSTNTYKTVTVPEDLTNVEFRIRITGGYNYVNVIYYPQLESGSTFTAFKPYENICPIYGWNSINIVKSKRNLFDYDENKVSSSETTTATIRAYYPLAMHDVTLTFSAKLKEGATTTGSDYLNIGSFIGSSGLLELQTSFITPDTITTRTRTFSGDKLPVLMSLENPVTIKSILSRYDIQIEIGSLSTDYESYNGQTITIPLNDTIYGGVLDVKNGVLRVTKRITTFNDCSWTSSTWGSYTAYSATLSDAKSNSTSTLSGLLCEIYPEVTPSAMYSSANEAMCLNGTIVRLRNTTYSTLEEWKEAVKNYKFVYPLATPIEIPLSDIPEIVTFIGTNNIFADSGDVEVKYKESIQKYIDDKIAETQALIL